jgi:ubiquinone/menaquinone biosynthesis C-methylase UbiE
MNTADSYQLSTRAAEGYERQKVPSLFGPMARATFDAISLPEGAHVIGVACGTGIISKVASERLSGRGRIVGTDLNPAMIEVARRTMPASRHTIEWFTCDVAKLPFEVGEFDIAFCQQGLQFFPDKPNALSEIRRVLATDGQLFLTCWKSVTPLFQAVSDSLRLRIGDEIAEQALRPYAFRDANVILSLLRQAGFKIDDASSLVVDRHLTPPHRSVREEILAQPFEQALRASGDATIDAIVGDVIVALEPYRSDEAITVPSEVYLFQARNDIAAYAAQH